MKKRLGLATIVFLLGFTAFALPASAEEAKIGIVDTQRVLDETTLGSRMKEELNAHVQSRQQIIDLEEGELKKMQEELTRQGAALSDKKRMEKEEAFQKKYVEYQKKASELQREIQTKKLEKLKEFNDLLVAATRKVAEAEGVALMLANDPETGGILYAKPSMNLTDRVIQEINRATAEEKPEGEKKPDEKK
ncbi:MAG: OmpH family outer membrane protein [Nitrospirae bacterium]|nr:OmpH family outer membrane protein [Nitrospirota bacterium]